MHPFDYERAGSIAEALALAGQPGARFIAGGTTLYDLMKLGVERPSVVVDIRRIPQLSQVRWTPAELSIGSGARMSDVAAEPGVLETFPMLAQSLLQAATPQIRNMATIGGNLLQRTRCTYFRGGHPCAKRVPGEECSAREGVDEGQAVLGAGQQCTAVYPGDLAVALVALEAVIDIVGLDGVRTLPIADLHLLPGSTPWQDNALADGELITAVRIPISPVARTSTYLKLRPRESYAFAWASAAVGLQLEDDGRVIDCRIALGGLATRPWRVKPVEKWLVGRTLDSATAGQAGHRALAGATPGRHNAFRIELGRRAVAEALIRVGNG